MVSLFGSGTRRHLAAQVLDEPGSNGASPGHDGGAPTATAVELYDDAESTLHVLPAADPIDHDADDDVSSHYPMATVRPSPGDYVRVWEG